MNRNATEGLIKSTGYVRRISREVKIGSIALGGNNPIRLQSMTTTNTNDIEATARQAVRIAAAGGHYVRITVQGVREAESLSLIRKRLEEQGYTFPLIADIHFNPQAALAVARYVEKIRINPGNYADSRSDSHAGGLTDSAYKMELGRVEERLLPLLKICSERNVALRIGVNHGSLSDRIMNRFGDTPEGMADSAMEFLRICRKHNFHNLVVSMKASSARTMVYATRLLVARMDGEQMDYPIHLGVTEAGEGEDGRIKSAVGIGTLLVDGIGDTIRVSLTEEPENEIPVGKQLADLFENQTIGAAGAEEAPCFNPFLYSRRKTREINGIGGERPISVLANLSHCDSITVELLERTGWFFNANTQVWSRSDTGADFVICGNASLNGLPCHDQLPLIGSTPGCKFLLEKGVRKGMAPGSFVLTSHSALMQLFSGPENILNENVVLLIGVDQLSDVYGVRRALFTMHRKGLKIPVAIYFNNKQLNYEHFQLEAATLLGSFFVDGIADSLMLGGTLFDSQQYVSTSFAILQASGARITRTEFISCPGCGRTLFNLNQTLKSIKEKTSHLRGLKIGVMGCIVNGPGEMADAHYGYVGAGPGRITLYKGREVVKKNIPETEALDELIALIKTNGDWIEP